MRICPCCGKPISPYAKACCGKQVPREYYGIIQIETTGLDPDRDEILKITVLNRQGKLIWNRLYKPERVQSWEDARKVNGITPHMVSKCRPFKGREVSDLTETLAKEKITIFVTNAECFVRKFLYKAGFLFPPGRIYGITGSLFSEYSREHDISVNPTMANILTLLNYPNKKPNQERLNYEKAIQIWYCYQCLKPLSKKEILYDMAAEGKAGGMTYGLFYSREQILDYLKATGACSKIETSVPEIFYDGRYTVKPTFDCSILGLNIEWDKDHNPSVKRVVIHVNDGDKGIIVALSESEFVDMQQRGDMFKNYEEENPLLWEGSGMGHEAVV